jgi:hypothetical protein
VSNFIRRTKNPATGKFENATWLDNHFGGHRYGVRFPSDGMIYNAELQGDWEFEDHDATPDDRWIR